MLRIASGMLGGRYITQPPSRSVRPMTDKVRQALFNAAGPVDGLIVLDAYAGSGAVAFEALSRGAAMVEAIESDRRTAGVIEANAKELDVSWGFLLSVMTVETWLAQPTNTPASPRYDLIVADPPYAKLDADIVGRLGQFLLPSGIMVVSHSSKQHMAVPPTLKMVQNKVYGDSALTFYKLA